MERIGKNDIYAALSFVFSAFSCSSYRNEKTPSGHVSHLRCRDYQIICKSFLIIEDFVVGWVISFRKVQKPISDSSLVGSEFYLGFFLAKICIFTGSWQIVEVLTDQSKFWQLCSSDIDHEFHVVFTGFSDVQTFSCPCDCSGYRRWWCHGHSLPVRK